MANNKLQKVASEDALAALRQEYPTEPTFNRILLPRLALVSQDKTEEVKVNGKKQIKIVDEAGTFYTERETDELEDVLDDNGKKVGTKKKWERNDIGEGCEGIIIFKRYQLRMYDEATEKYTSSPVYDTDDQVLPLFCEKVEVDRGTPKELQAKYQFTDKKGKVKSALESNRILYVLYEGDVYQLNLRGSSMYAFLTYSRKVVPNTVLTTFGSEAKENGGIKWNQMTFEATRVITAEEAETIMAKITEIKESIAAERGFYASGDTQRAEGESDEDFADRKKRLKSF